MTGDHPPLWPIALCLPSASGSLPLAVLAAGRGSWLPFVLWATGRRGAGARASEQTQSFPAVNRSQVVVFPVRLLASLQYDGGVEMCVPNRSQKHKSQPVIQDGDFGHKLSNRLCISGSACHVCLHKINGDQQFHDATVTPLIRRRP